MYVKYTEEQTDITEGTVTLARDSESDSVRTFIETEGIVPLDKNTDFSEIINSRHLGPTNAYFYLRDLRRYSVELEKITDGKYKYSNSNYEWQKHYVGTIVVPVKTLLKGEKGTKCEILGFLCADSMSKKAFTEKQKIINIKLMQMFADIYSSVVISYKNKLCEYSIEMEEKEND